MKHPHHKGGLALGALTAPLTTPELKLTAEQQAAIDGVLAFCKDPGGGLAHGGLGGPHQRGGPRRGL